MDMKLLVSRLPHIADQSDPSVCKYCGDDYVAGASCEFRHIHSRQWRINGHDRVAPVYEKPRRARRE